MMGNIFGCVVTRMYLTRVPEQCLLEVPTLRREQNSAHKVKLSGHDFQHHNNCLWKPKKVHCCEALNEMVMSWVVERGCSTHVHTHNI
jgi:hypothetical protein